jgi:rhomboid-like protein
MMERGSRDSPISAVNGIVAANIVVFLLWPALSIEVMAGHFLVSWSHLEAGRVWTLVTAVFSHNMLFHIFINMIVLVSFGPSLERLMGTARFLIFYLMAGMVGSLAHAVVSATLIGRPEQAALGASSAIAGVLLLFSLVFPKARVLFFFILPVPAIVAALLFIGVDIWGLVAQIEGAGLPIGHGAHLGGAAVGIAWFIARSRTLQRRARGVA